MLNANDKIIEEYSFVENFINNNKQNQGYLIPFNLFEYFFNQAKNNDKIKDPTAFCLATCQSNLPDARILLLKHFDQNGFVFFTNKNSKKANDIALNSNAAMCFYWDEIGVQVRIKGVVKQTNQLESDKYFASRSFESKIGAIVSKQSSVLECRKKFVDEYNSYCKNLQNNANGNKINLTCPLNWGGYRITPSEIEFWHDRPFRLHDRTVFTLDTNSASWKITKLYP